MKIIYCPIVETIRVPKLMIENDYEDTLLLELPPHARDIALDFLSTRSLGQLLRMLHQNEPITAILSKKRVMKSLWKPILKAAVLAKTTYFIPNPEFSQKQMLFLLKSACLAADYPLSVYSLPEVMQITEKKMPIFHEWLSTFAEELVRRNMPTE